MAGVTNSRWVKFHLFLLHQDILPEPIYSPPEFCQNISTRCRDTVSANIGSQVAWSQKWPKRVHFGISYLTCVRSSTGPLITSKVPTLEVLTLQIRTYGHEWLCVWTLPKIVRSKGGLSIFGTTPEPLWVRFWQWYILGLHNTLFRLDFDLC